jgi:hypothetical protein
MTAIKPLQSLELCVPLHEIADCRESLLEHALIWEKDCAEVVFAK